MCYFLGFVLSQCLHNNNMYESLKEVPLLKTTGTHYAIFLNLYLCKDIYDCCDSSDISGGILKPTLAGSTQPSSQPEKLVSDDLDSSLANLVGSECDVLLSAALIRARVH